MSYYTRYTQQEAGIFLPQLPTSSVSDTYGA
jgi:hypothetical protein